MEINNNATGLFSVQHCSLERLNSEWSTRAVTGGITSATGTGSASSSSKTGIRLYSDSRITKPAFLNPLKTP